MFAAFPELKMDAETEHFWQKGYGKKVVAPAAATAMKRYIRTQWERLDGFERWGSRARQGGVLTTPRSDGHVMKEETT